ncbi:hypothetical protein [Streptomyces phytophilus]|uniref:hypothetical protein n=1 Tax=Streptomyces phytophilus TaxID=722715 RepID=UPI0015F0AA61|nr:hypothetical protein [Streptomyces phytophilus]
MKTAEDYRERVERGAVFLDEKVPGWVDRIDLDTLDVAADSLCVAAQAVGSAYYIAQTKLGQSDEDAQERGFVLPEHEHDERADELIAADEDDEVETIYAPLTQAWRRLIERRRGATS